MAQSQTIVAKLDWSRLLGFDQVADGRQLEASKLNAPRRAKIGGKAAGKTK